MHPCLRFIFITNILIELLFVTAAPIIPPSVSQPLTNPPLATADPLELDGPTLADAPDPDGTESELGVLNGEEVPPVNLLEGGSRSKWPVDIVRADYPDCPLSCLQGMHGDGWCNTECAVPECGNDPGDCDGFCAPDCKEAWVGDGLCDKECFREECNFDGGDCDRKFKRGDLIFPPPGHDSFDYSGCQCAPRLLNNGKCNPPCNNIECNWDGGDCRHYCSPGCVSAWLGDDECDSPCNNEECGFDKGDCKECSPGCVPSMIGNGVCDGSCMNDACQWDMGDCAGVCKVYPVDYDSLPFEYNLCRNEWAGDGACDCLCMNTDCHMDYNDCAGQEERCRAVVQAAESRYGYSWPLGPVKVRPSAPPAAEAAALPQPLPLPAQAVTLPGTSPLPGQAVTLPAVVEGDTLLPPAGTTANVVGTGTSNANVSPGSTFLIEGSATVRQQQ